jgi:O-methyltransferase involved in polyketide biosynthesis
MIVRQRARPARRRVRIKEVAPESRVAYVDNDPMVLTHAYALLVSSPEGATDYIEADVRDTGTILRRAADTLDFSRPVAITMLGILPFIGDDAEARVIDSVQDMDEYCALGRK